MKIKAILVQYKNVCMSLEIKLLMTLSVLGHFAI